MAKIINTKNKNIFFKLFGDSNIIEENLKKKTINYLDIFKDHPYIFNLGHGVLPQTKPETVEHIVKFVREKSA